MVDMYDKVVSTKLTEEEHNNLLELCNKIGCTPSKIIRKTLLEKIESEIQNEKIELKNEEIKELSMDELRKALGLKNKKPKLKLKSDSCIFTKSNASCKVN